MILEKPGLSKRQKQSRMFGILIGVGILLVVIAIMAVIPVTPYAVYNNAGMGVRFRYPKAWQVVNHPDVHGAIVTVVAPQQTAMDTYAENVNVSFQDVTAPMSMAQFNQLAIRQFTGTFKKGVKVITSETDRLSGHSGYRFSYIIEAEPPLQMTHVWTLVGRRAYIVTYGGTVNDVPVFAGQFESILKSFKIY